MSAKSQTADAESTDDENNKPPATDKKTTAENKKTVLDLDDGELRSNMVCGLHV